MMLDILCFSAIFMSSVVLAGLWWEDEMAKKTNKHHLYVYRDYIALCYARDIDEAVYKFGRVYEDASRDNIYMVWFNPYKVAVLHDYEGR